jgi:hypothetical protein
MDLLAILPARHGAGSVGWHWGGGTSEHPATIAYRKLGLPVVVAKTTTVVSM